MRVHVKMANLGLLLAAAAISIFSACEKKRHPVPRYTGVWKGTFIDGQTGIEGKCTYVFTEKIDAGNARYKIMYYNSWDTANAMNKYYGTYRQVYYKAYINYTLTSNGAVYYSEEAVMDETKRHFDGTWGFKQDPANGGTTKADLQ
jgi:hypothetical protein